MLAAAVNIANAQLAEDNLPPLPDGLTPHSLRRTFASVLYALGESPATVMAELGHADPELALRIYAGAMSRDPGENERLRALVDAAVLADTGRRSAESASNAQPIDAPETPKARQ